MHFCPSPQIHAGRGFVHFVQCVQRFFAHAYARYIWAYFLLLCPPFYFFFSMRVKIYCTYCTKCINAHQIRLSVIFKTA